MKKPSLIIGKKQIILAGMTLVLGLAIYINYAYSATGGKIKATEVVKNQSVNYGESQLVSKTPEDDYFAKARIDRSTSRGEAVETLKSIIGGGDSTEEEKQTASLQAQTMSNMMEKENKVENLVKAAGFKDCVVYLDGVNANIVVKTGNKDGLMSSEAAKIKDILLSEVKVANENIRIFDVT